ncbi:MAG: DUF222 domain-containing protein [Acidimicrobiia bacterium]
MELAERDGVLIRRDARRLADAHARVNQAMLGLFDAMAELDDGDTLRENYVTDMGSWLAFDLGLDPKTARGWTRVANALVDLPLTRQAFRTGAICLDEVRILCRYATVDNEATLLSLTREHEVGDLAAAVRDYLEIQRAAAKPKPATWLQMGWSEDDSALWLRGEIAGVDGLMVETTLRRLATQAPLDHYAGLYRNEEEINGEALVQIASEATAEDRDHDRATLVVHFDAGDLKSGKTSGMVGSQLIDRDELLRIACDSRLQPAIDDPSGVTIGVGRTTRKIPAWLRRLVEGRDEGCRFPGCGRNRWTHAHHLVHWAKGGPTNLDNLVTLCGFHHRLIHRKGWEITGNPNGPLTFLAQGKYEYRPARSQYYPGHQRMLLDNLDSYHRLRLGQLATANSPP